MTKHNWVIALTLIAILSACKKNDSTAAVADPYSLTGNWKLSLYAGSAAGYHLAPVPAGTNDILNFSTDSIFTEHVNNTQQYQARYTILKNYKVDAYNTDNVLKSGSYLFSVYFIYHGQQDTLWLTTATNFAANNLDYGYIRVK